MTKTNVVAHRPSERHASGPAAEKESPRRNACARRNCPRVGPPRRGAGRSRSGGGSSSHQAIMRPDGMPVWTSGVVAGHDHDLTAARDKHVLGALYWAASQRHLPPGRWWLRGRRPGRPRPVQAARRRQRPRGRSPDLQRATTRPAHWANAASPTDHPLEGPATHHRQSLLDRRHRWCRNDAHPIRTTRHRPILPEITSVSPDHPTPASTRTWTVDG